MVTLDFTNFTNLMAHYYGQTSTLKGGDYLFDQLWWSHGVKVSGRIGHPLHRHLHRLVFIPKFIRGTGWVDSRK